MTEDNAPLNLFGTWLGETRDIQTEYFGYNFDKLTPARPENIPALIKYLSWNTKSAMHELVEADNETSWKPWQHDDPYVNRDAYVGEVVDVLHFLGNMLVALDCTTEELNAAYTTKLETNRERQRRKYRIQDAGEKCCLCLRALDDHAVQVAPSGDMCVPCADKVRS